MNHSGYQNPVVIHQKDLYTSKFGPYEQIQWEQQEDNLSSAPLTYSYAV